MIESIREGLSSVGSLSAGHGYFEALGGVRNGAWYAEATTGWKVQENISLFGRAQVDPMGYAVLGGVQINY